MMGSSAAGMSEWLWRKWCWVESRVIRSETEPQKQVWLSGWRCSKGIQLRMLRWNSDSVSSLLGRESACRESEAAAQLPFYELTYDLSDLQSYCSQKGAMIKNTFYGAGDIAQQGKHLLHRPENLGLDPSCSCKSWAPCCVQSQPCYEEIKRWR